MAFAVAVLLAVSSSFFLGGAHAACSTALASVGNTQLGVIPGLNFAVAQDGANACFRVTTPTAPATGWAAVGLAASPGTMNGGQVTVNVYGNAGLSGNYVLGDQQCPNCAGGTKATTFTTSEFTTTKVGANEVMIFARASGMDLSGPNNMLAAMKSSAWPGVHDQRAPFCVDFTPARVADGNVLCNSCPCAAIVVTTTGVATTTGGATGSGTVAAAAPALGAVAAAATALAAL